MVFSAHNASKARIWDQSFRSKTRYKPLTSRVTSLAFKWPQGCEGGVTAALLVGIFTLILNVAMACWLAAQGGIANQLVVFQRRDCESSKKITIAAHVVINVLAALLLAVSNYCMQILSSPLREEVDIAHAAKKWIYIGVPNINNLRHMPWTRRVLFLTLAVSSLPVHLLWNSAIVQEIPANNYRIAAVTEEFGPDAPFDTTREEVGFMPADADVFEREWYEPMLRDPVNFTVAECLAKYSQPFISNTATWHW